MAAERWHQADLALNSGFEEAQRLTRWAPDEWPVAADWQSVVQPFWSSAEGVALGQFMQARLAANALVYPPQPLRALSLTALAEVRMVILGQDPYHGPGQAEGLAFSVAPTQKKIPPSLRNIFKELQRDLGLPLPPHGSLADWASQGVLLLNTCLTVEDSQPASHSGRGWEALTDALVLAVAARAPACAYLLWGAHAQSKAALIQRAAASGPSGTKGALVLSANHPSPLSALRPPQPFIGCGHFSQALAWLAARGETQIHLATLQAGHF